MTKDENSLLPCPFCGEKPLIRPQCPSIEGDAWTKITCDCRVEPSVTVYEDNTHFETAKHLWNTRATPDIPEKVDVEKLKRKVPKVPTHRLSRPCELQAIMRAEMYNKAIDHLAAAGYLREPLERIEGLEDE